MTTTTTTWKNLTDRINKRTIVNKRLGAIDLIIETGILPFDIIGTLDYSVWENADGHATPIRICDAKAWFISIDFIATEAKANDKIINPATDETWIILSAEPRTDGTTVCLLRKYIE